ncbi:hypothetical protein [Massilia timonae]|uniref:hypothetical protein n=1 Tax=Massilia timonae TaxID=47229 RepID=UPI0008F5B371|nr:hypothetical protein [Massilia timonae]
MSRLIRKIPLGKLSGGAQDDVELVLARDVLKLEREMGQPMHTLNIPSLVKRLNQEHEFVEPHNVPALAANVERAYGYVAEQVPLKISQAGYKSYQADEAVKAVRQSVGRLGATAKEILSKSHPA